jgi:hypothetical protein
MKETGNNNKRQSCFEQNSYALNAVFVHITFLVLGIGTEALREYLKLQNTEQRVHNKLYSPIHYVCGLGFYILCVRFPFIIRLIGRFLLLLLFCVVPYIRFPMVRFSQEFKERQISKWKFSAFQFFNVIVKFQSSVL